MKTTVNLILVVLIVTVSACNKDNSTVGSVDVSKYESSLNTDYTAAMQYQTALSGNVAPSDKVYNTMMYNREDSLFSYHFYEFCTDMIQNSGMMGSSSGMMGGSGGMNGGGGGMSATIKQMMDYMDSLQVAAGSMMKPDFELTDSLMYNKMQSQKLMVVQTNGITNVFNKMQTLRRVHMTMH